MKTLKIILKVILLLVLFAVLIQVFKAIGLTTLGYFNIDTNLEFGANIKASIEILSFLIALFLSIKSFKSKKYLKWTVIGLFSLLLVLVLSIVTTKIILGNEKNTSVTQREELTISKKIYSIKDPLVKSITNQLYKNIDYSKEAHNKRLNGTVVLSFKLYEDGTATITKLEGEEQFYESIRESVKKTFPVKVMDSNKSFPRDMSIKINFRFNR